MPHNSITTPSKKSKIKNSGHIKTLLSQCEQSKKGLVMNEHPITFSITKKAPAIKILNKRPPELLIPQVTQPSPINTAELFISVPAVTDSLIRMPEQIELSVQEVVIESTPSFANNNNKAESQTTEQISDLVTTNTDQIKPTANNDSTKSKSRLSHYYLKIF